MESENSWRKSWRVCGQWKVSRVKDKGGGGGRGVFWVEGKKGWRRRKEASLRGLAPTVGVLDPGFVVAVFALLGRLDLVPRCALCASVNERALLSP